jgi:membrane-bound ClpP family serine protease
MWFGFVLMILGVFMLLERLDILQGSAWSYFWPIAIMALGLSIVFNQRRDQSRHD